MKVKIGSLISFGIPHKLQPTQGDLRGLKKDLGTNRPHKLTKDLAYLTLKYKG